MFSEDEEALREHVERFATEVLGPKVAKMDAQEALDADVVAALFEQVDVCPSACVRSIYAHTRTHTHNHKHTHTHTFTNTHTHTQTHTHTHTHTYAHTCMRALERASSEG